MGFRRLRECRYRGIIRDELRVDPDDVWSGVELYEVIPALQPGDRVVVRTLTAEPNEYEVTVKKYHAEVCELENGGTLWKRSVPRNNRTAAPGSWLRDEGGDSLGRVDEIEIIELVGAEP